MREGLRKSLRQVTKCGHQGGRETTPHMPADVRRRTPRRRGQGGDPRRSGPFYGEAW